MKMAGCLVSLIIPQIRPSVSPWPKWASRGRSMISNTDASTIVAPRGPLLSGRRGATSGRCASMSVRRTATDRSSKRIVKPRIRTLSFADGCAILHRRPRSPSDNKWYGFLSRTLLFGEVAAVLRYNCSSRIIAALTNLRFGLSVVNYIEDYGFPLPTEISVKELQVFSYFANMIRNWLKDGKTRMWRQIVRL